MIKKSKFVRGLSIVVLTLVLAAAVMLVPGIVPYAQAQQDSTPSITVTGVGEITLEPDIAVVTVTISTTEPTMRAALTRNTADTERVIAALVAMDIDEDDITTVSFWTQPERSWGIDGQSQITGQTASHSLSVTIRDLDTVGEVLSTATEAGATSVGDVRFSVADTGDAYNQALALAVRSARSKADAIAVASDTTITGIISITENVRWNPPVVARAESAVAIDAIMAAGDSGVPIQSGGFAVRAEVQVVYGVR